MVREGLVGSIPIAGTMMSGSRSKGPEDHAGKREPPDIVIPLIGGIDAGLNDPYLRFRGGRRSVSLSRCGPVVGRMLGEHKAAGSNPVTSTKIGADMQSCDSTCFWCAKHFWLFVMSRMKSSEREAGRSGSGSFALAAASSIRTPK